MILIGQRIARWVVPALLAIARGMDYAQQSPAASGVRKVGTIKSISGNTLVLKVDNGPEVNVTVQDSTRVLRTADLKTTTPAQAKDLQVGDRLLISAATESDPLVATRIVLMKQGDVNQTQQQQLQDWQKRGVGGIVSAINGSDITVSVTPTVSFVVKTTPNT